LEMDDCAIERSVLLAVDYPFSFNTRRFSKAASGSSQFVCFGSVHPYQPFMRATLKRHLKKGIRGLKVHPGAQQVPVSCNRAMKLYRLAADNNLPMFFHCGPVGIEPESYRRLSLVDTYGAAVAENPRTTFVLGHSGALEMEKALALQLEYPNVYLDLTCQGLDNVAIILDEGDPDRIVNGSDWPFYHEAISIAKVLMLTVERPELRHKVLYQNMADLLAR
ncbi:MAG: amidohydrolase family protein, partial [Proteobacteria bacterium]|nr:amidohydrolase family protein [Pseudomonadota bacterium]